MLVARLDDLKKTEARETGEAMERRDTLRASREAGRAELEATLGRVQALEVEGKAALGARKQAVKLAQGTSGPYRASSTPCCPAHRTRSLTSRMR